MTLAERRMFTKKITDSDSFIELSSAAQALYLHLNQSCDDDGFTNQVQMAMWKAHASVDDLKVLLAKKFVLTFESGVIVIKHWRLHNTIRKDRYTPTNYQEELKQLGIKDNGAYTLGSQEDTEWLPGGCQKGDERLPNGCPGIGKGSIGKVSVGEGSRVEVEVLPPCPTLEEIRNYITQHGLNVNAEKFFRYYDQNGWKTIKGKDIKWQDKLHEWSESEGGGGGNKSKGSCNPFADIAKNL